MRKSAMQAPAGIHALKEPPGAEQGPRDGASGSAAEYLVEFEEEGHRYFVNGEEKLSTTQILHEAGAVDDTFYTEQSRWRGTEVHRIVAGYNLTRPVKDAEPKYQKWASGWARFCGDRKFTAVRVEHIVYDCLLDVCGRVDALGLFYGDSEINVIADAKSKTVGGQIPKAVALQMASYGHALNPRSIFRRIAVVLFPDGDFQVQTYPVEEYLEHVADFAQLVAGVRVRNKYL